MSSIRIRVSSAIGNLTRPVNLVPLPKRVSLQQVGGGQAVSFPLGPLKVSYDSLGLDYVAIERPGDVALLEATTRKARRVSMDITIADIDTRGKVSIQDTLDKLEAIADDDIDCIFIYGVRTLPFHVRLTDFSYNSVRRDLDGNITRALARLQLDERPARKSTIVSLSAIEYTPITKSSKGTKKGAPKDKPNDSRGYDPPDPLLGPGFGPGGPTKPRYG